MAAALGVKDSPFMRIGSFDGLGDFRTLAGPGRLPNAAISHYTTGNILGRLNTPANVNLHNLTPSTLIQPNHAQNLGNSITVLGKMHPAANQNPSLFQGIPSSLELDQLQQNTSVNFNSVDGSRMHEGLRNNPLILHGNYQQTLRGQGFGNQSTQNTGSYTSESFDVGLNGSSIQQKPLLSTEPFHCQLPMNQARHNNFSGGLYLQNNPTDISTSTMALPIEDLREMQCQEGLVGDRQNSGHGSRITLDSLNSLIPSNSIVSPLNQNSDQHSGVFNEKMQSGRFGGCASTLMPQNESENFAPESRTRANENFLLEQPKLQSGFVHRSYDSLDDMMNAMIKRV